jgi:hypothetical protein
MKAFISAVILCLCLVACGHCIPPDWAKEYVELFNYESEIRGCFLRADEITYVMHEDFERWEYIGYCEYATDTIAVRESWWVRASDTQKEILMFHEMGHCILGWGHLDSGIMQPILMSPKQYEANRKQLLDQLFSACGRNLRPIVERIY